MIESTLLVELIKLVGFPAVIFAIWYVSHISNKEMFATMQSQFRQIIETQEKSTERNFELLSEILDITRSQAALMSELKTLIKLNQYCPLSRKDN
ncbi:MAG: hypothetical protein AB1706_10210 [Pseudomonadota bacterium]